MQNVPGRALVALVALVLMFPGLAGAVMLEQAPASPICLGAAAPAPCAGGGSSLPSHVIDYDLAAALGATGIATGAQLVLHLWDDKGQGDGSEKIDITVGETLLFHNADVQHDIVIDLSDPAMLDDGQLGITLTARTGDFFFGGSTLTVSVEPGPPPSSSVATDALASVAAVPAPAPLLLLGLGLALLAVGRRWGGPPLRRR